MKVWKKEDVSSFVDGLTDTFSVSQNYEPGKILPRVNGNTLVEGVVEIPPNSIQLPFTPKLGDHVVIYYFKNA
jgi:hypothetical protein